MKKPKTNWTKHIKSKPFIGQIKEKAKKVTKKKKQDQRKEEFKVTNETKFEETSKSSRKENPKTHLTLRMKMILGFVVPVILMIMLGVISYSQARNGMSLAYEKATSQALVSMGDYFDYVFNSIHGIGADCVIDATVKSYVDGTNAADRVALRKESSAVKNLLNLKKISNSYITNIYLIPSDDKKIISTNNNKNPGFYQELKDSNSSSGIVIDQYGTWLGYHDSINSKLDLLDNEFGISLIRDFSTSDAFLVIDLDAVQLREQISHFNLEGDSILGFVTTDGKETLISNSEETPDHVFVEQDFYQKAAESEDMSGMKYVSFKGETYFFIYNKIEMSNAMLALLVPQSVVVKQADTIKAVSFVCVTIACITAIAIAIILSNSIGGKISYLVKQLLKISQGDLTTEIHCKGRDEVAVLGNSIHNTVQTIKGLLQKVANTSNEVKEESDRVGTSSEELKELSENIMESIRQITQAVESEATSTQSCVIDCERLSDVITNVNSSVMDINAFANETKSMVDSDISKMQELNQQSDSTTEMMKMLTQSISELEEKSKYIHTFVDVINGIADQTNLLSLNASIEAARAGEAGRGFGVVAMEIRKLSEESSKAAGEIRKAALEITSKMQSTIQYVEDTESILKEQNTTESAIITAFHELYEGLEKLHGNIDDIGNRMKDMEEARNTTLESITNISASTEETTSVSECVAEAMEAQQQSVAALQKTSDDMMQRANELEKAINIFTI